MSAGSVLGAAVGAIGGLTGVVSALTYRLKKREVVQAGDKSMVDAAKSLTETSLALLKPVQEAAAKAEEQVKALKSRIVELETAMQAAADTFTSTTENFTAERDKMQRQLDSLQRQLAEVTAERDRYRDRLGAGNPDAAVA